MSFNLTRLPYRRALFWHSVSVRDALVYLYSPYIINDLHFQGYVRVRWVHFGVDRRRRQPIRIRHRTRLHPRCLLFHLPCVSFVKPYHMVLLD